MGIEDEIRRQLAESQIRGIKVDELRRSKELINRKQYELDREEIQRLCRNCNLKELIEHGIREVARLKPWELNLQVIETPFEKYHREGTRKDFAGPYYLRFHVNYSSKNLQSNRQSASSVGFMVGPAESDGDSIGASLVGDILQSYPNVLKLMVGSGNVGERLYGKPFWRYYEKEVWYPITILQNKVELEKIIATTLIEPKNWHTWSPSHGSSSFRDPMSGGGYG